MRCLGVVLAGGLSSRMGQNKAFLPHNGASLEHRSTQLTHQTMLDFSTNLLAQCHLDKVIVSGENCLGLADIVPQGGPLSGIYSAIKQYQPQSVLAIPVDMPFLSATLLQELRLKGELSGKACYFNRSSLPVYLPITAVVEQYLQQTFNSAEFMNTGKGPSFKEVLRRSQGQSIHLKNTKALINTNTPEQWRAAQKQIITM
ncbi:molybdenum cofactor guanylyltransferase [Thalassotalea aquiviva]|uniref:molybdenum cofactor guanylyltransferase n=1 Tax=Thalassotalea aquiviva TaxID=3242415 RepID=UPI003529E4DE